VALRYTLFGDLGARRCHVMGIFKSSLEGDEACVGDDLIYPSNFAIVILRGEDTQLLAPRINVFKQSGFLPLWPTKNEALMEIVHKISMLQLIKNIELCVIVNYKYLIN